MASVSLSAIPPKSTATASGGPQYTLAAGGVSQPGAPPVPLVSRFVVRFAPRDYLRAYLDSEGICLTADIRDAKLFKTFTIARRIATLFHGEAARVICTIDGRDVRVALIETIFETVLEGGETDKKPTNVTGVRGVDSGEDAPRTFFAVRAPDQPTLDGRTLLFNFLSDYLGVSVFGIQPGFKHLPDTYLFKGPFGSTAAVPTSIMLLDRDAALAIVREKINQKLKAFEGGQ